MWVYFITGRSGIIPRTQKCVWNNNLKAVIYLSIVEPGQFSQIWSLWAVTQTLQFTWTSTPQTDSRNTQVCCRQAKTSVHDGQAQLKSGFYLDYKEFTWLGAHWILSPLWQIYNFVSSKQDSELRCSLIAAFQALIGILDLVLHKIFLYF